MRACRARLDIRGAGGYVLLPPSSDASGGVYQDEVSRPLFKVPLADMPPWLLARLVGRNGQGTAPSVGDVIPDWSGIRC